MSDLTRRRFLTDLLCVGGVIALAAGIAHLQPHRLYDDVRSSEPFQRLRSSPIVQIFYPYSGLVGNLG